MIIAIIIMIIIFKTSTANHYLSAAIIALTPSMLIGKIRSSAPCLAVAEAIIAGDTI